MAYSNKKNKGKRKFKSNATYTPNARNGVSCISGWFTTPYGTMVSIVASHPKTGKINFENSKGQRMERFVCKIEEGSQSCFKSGFWYPDLNRLRVPYGKGKMIVLSVSKKWAGFIYG